MSVAPSGVMRMSTILRRLLLRFKKCFHCGVDSQGKSHGSRSHRLSSSSYSSADLRRHPPATMTHPAAAPHANWVRASCIGERGFQSASPSLITSASHDDVGTPAVDGEAAVAHHASAEAETPSTHRGELCPAPWCICRPILPPHLRRLITTDATRADDAPIRKTPRRQMKSRVEEVRLLRTCTGGQVYQLHLRHWVVIVTIYASEQEHFPRGAVALLHIDRDCTVYLAAGQWWEIHKRPSFLL
jgi:hypothetical protein